MNMGNNFGVPSMVFNFYGGTPQNDDSDSDESSDDESASSSVESEEVDGNRFQTDSAATFLRPDLVSVGQVQKYEHSLDLGETISLIFLLFDEHSYALQTMKVLIAQGPETFSKCYISEWFAKKGPNKVSVKLLESLAVIQNYRVLKCLGVSRDEANVRFLPSRDSVLFINRVKKMLYLLVDSLSSEEATAMVTNCRNDGKGKGLFENDPTLSCNPRFTEFHLLFWIDRRYITIETERINLDNLISVMTDPRKHVVPFILSPKVKNRLQELKDMVKDITEKKLPEQTNEDNIYPIIDENEVGLMLIINFDNFDKREEREEYLDILSPVILNNRIGSKEADVKRVQYTFAAMLNFKVDTIENICHFEMQEQIETKVKENYSPNLSMLFLCILSHGSKGVIYASNSCPVRIEDIKNMISGKSLVGRMFADKPKVIIVQACQGSGRLSVEPEPELKEEREGEEGEREMVKDDGHQLDSGEASCLDGPSRCSEHADILLCMPVIEGYAAIRHKKQGSFYIHEICKKIIKYRHQKHFEEIMVRVHRSLNNMSIHVELEDVKRESPCEEGHMNCVIMFMTPKKESTLRRDLYLTKQIERC